MSGRFHAVPVKTNLSYDEFLHDTSSRDSRLLIKGALQDWNALKWTPQYLERTRSARARFAIGPRTGPRAASSRSSSIASSTDRATPPAPYLRNINLGEQLPELVEDITPEPGLLAEELALPRLRCPVSGRRAVTKEPHELFVSRAAAAFPYLHIDYWGMSGFFAQICGEKEVILFPPDDAPNLYPTADNRLVSEIKDFDHPDYDRYPGLRKTRQHRVTIGAGDLLYNPAWWHTTKTTQTAVTLIWAYWNRHEWTHLLEEVRRAGRTQEPTARAVSEVRGPVQQRRRVSPQ